MATKKRSPHEEFKHHAIMSRDARSLELRNPKNSNLWCTITIDHGLQIAVLGDFGPVVFGHCVAKTLEGRIAWIGSHSQADSYICEKASIGMSNVRHGISESSFDYFKADVTRAFENERELLADGNAFTPAHARNLTWDAFELASGITEDDCSPCATIARRKLLDYLESIDMADDAWEWIGGLGLRPMRDIALAHAALRRAHLLIEAGSV